MVNIERVANGWIIRGRKKDTGLPISFVAKDKDELIFILEHELEL